MRTARLSRLADQDLLTILTWSEANFGRAARLRYRALIRTAIGMVAADPERALSVARPELGDGVRSWHLRNSRDRSSAGRVNSPRHILFYRVDGDEVVIGRVLDHAMDPTLHVTLDMDWSEPVSHDGEDLRGADPDDLRR
jgi:toxin ParE1/3/4